MSGDPKNDPKLVLSLPQSVLETIPGGTPPPGIQALSPHPATLRPQTIIVGSVFLGVAAIFFAIRIYVKTRVIKKLGLDDYICTTAFAFAIVQYVGIVLTQTQGAGGRHQWDSTVAELLATPNCIANWISSVFVTPALGLAKLIFLIQYYQLFWPLRWVRVACWSVGSLFELYYLGASIAMFIICSPWPGETWRESILTTHYSKANKTSLPTGTIGAAFDIFLLVLPIRAVATLQLERGRKIGLMLVFLVGALASVASIVGLVYRVAVTNDMGDAEWNVTKFWIWVQVELFLGIACSCMPFCWKLVSHQRRKNSAQSSMPRRLKGYFRGAQHSKLSDDGQESPSTQTSVSSNSERARQEKTGFQLNEITGGRDTRQGVHSDNHIHVVEEVSVYGEQRQDSIERGIVDQRW